MGFPLVGKTSTSPRAVAAGPARGFPIGRVAGIRITLDPSWFFIGTLLLLSLYIHFSREFAGRSAGAHGLAAGTGALLFFLSVLLHEYSHSLVARLKGIPVDEIVLFIFGGVSRLGGEPRRPGHEFVIAAAGPATSLVLAGLFRAASRAIPFEPSLAAAVLAWLATVNLGLAIFNLLPAFPLDGGRVLRSILWRFGGSLLRATRVASTVGRGIAVLIMGFGFLTLAAWGGVLNGLWLMFIGGFLYSAAKSSLTDLQIREALGRRRVAQAMKRGCAELPAAAPVSSFVDEHVVARGERWGHVVGDGGPAGWVTLREVKRIPRDRWASTPLDAIMVPFSPGEQAAPSDTLREALEKMERLGVPQLPVLEEGRVVGMISREDLLRVAAIDLELESAAR